MVIPLGPIDSQPDIPVPDVVKEKYSKLWWAAAVLLIIAAVVDVIGGNVFDALYMALFSGVMIYCVKNDCKNMNMCCVFMLGVLCSSQAFFDLITLAGSLNGRTVKSTETQQVTGSVTEITVKVTKHPFFDPSEGLSYNIHSAMMIASPILMVILAAVTYVTYQAFPVSLFPDEAGDAEAGSLYGGRGMAAYGGTGGQAFGGGYAAPTARMSQPPRLFEGSGQRLGS
eukprot:TRINITY_DN31435_c0_g1_i1.p1 TRINITY_DN31435_c0_g1~~TRINITY_DN31435_c0_g1_i1.p1  ORF type:complete len:227 (-),score=40.67 TRINITY_DN31435_c0_g1_i1:285-965(-)